MVFMPCASCDCYFFHLINFTCFCRYRALTCHMEVISHMGLWLPKDVYQQHPSTLNPCLTVLTRQQVRGCQLVHERCLGVTQGQRSMLLQFDKDSVSRLVRVFNSEKIICFCYIVMGGNRTGGLWHVRKDCTVVQAKTAHHWSKCISSGLWLPSHAQGKYI